jgi:cytochrome P450
MVSVSTHTNNNVFERMNANEVSFITAQAWKDIYGHGHKQLHKFQITQPDRAASIVDAYSDEEHTRFRKSLANAFSEKALRTQEGLIKYYVDLLVQRLEAVAFNQDKTNM